MSTSLVIDTATNRTIVGIVSAGDVLFEEWHEGATDHGIALSQLVEKALNIHGNIDQVVVGMGPGPFTGLRVGIAFAHTFAMARKVPVIGVCSLDAIEVNADSYTIAIDARRKEIYWARYEKGNRVEGPSVNKPEEINDFIIGRYPSVTRLVELSDNNNVMEPMYLRRPDAVPTAERS